MLLATLTTPSGATTAAVQTDAGWLALEDAHLSALLARSDWRAHVEAQRSAGGAVIAETDAVYANPLPAPGKIICCGLNYADHIAEAGRATPEYPTLFAKFPDTLTGPSDEVRMPGSTKVDWEAELAVVVGAVLSRATVEEARAGIAAYTVSNDISARDWQARTLQWFQGKAFDASTPLGPVLVTADAIDPKAGLDIRCAINGEVVQDSNTRELVFDAADLVAYVSTFTTLRPGDIILSGTPGGTGLGLEPQRFLADGDILTTTIEGIGELRNTLRLDAPTTP